MKILIVYASTEGQTRKIARFCFESLSEAGHSAELIPAGEAAELDPSGYDGVILAASVHGGRYQSEAVDFARRWAQALAARRTLFLSVSLSAAGHEAEDWAGLERIARDFAEETRWQPGRVEQVAGALRFSEYDFFRAWAMRYIARHRDPDADTKGDTEYTDWDGLRRSVTEWAAG